MSTQEKKKGLDEEHIMGRNLTADCKKCRRSGEKLFLKGTRCHSAKCALEKRDFPPGPRAKRMKKPTEYGRRLREKQKVRFFYGVTEGQMKINFKKASRRKGIAGHNFLAIFEMRLDNALFRAQIAKSRKEARQIVLHGHVRINGKRMDIPSYSLKPGDEIKLKDASVKQFGDRFEATKTSGTPAWIVYSEKDKNLKISHEPERSEIDIPVEEQLVVEFYSQ
ncbi:MAG: small subunit ribosomal protein S4 [Candidatus Marinamargulisbacteria bacterium]|jgi:small subunit ribosomal protein S4